MIWSSARRGWMLSSIRTFLTPEYTRQAKTNLSFPWSILICYARNLHESKTCPLPECLWAWRSCRCFSSKYGIFIRLRCHECSRIFCSPIESPHRSQLGLNSFAYLWCNCPSAIRPTFFSLASGLMIVPDCMFPVFTLSYRWDVRGNQDDRNLLMSLILVRP